MPKTAKDRRGPRDTRTIDRYDKIHRARDQGILLRDLAKEWDISVERVRQILRQKSPREKPDA